MYGELLLITTTSIVKHMFRKINGYLTFAMSCQSESNKSKKSSL